MRIAALLLLIAAAALPRQALAQTAPANREYAVWSAMIDSALEAPGLTPVVLGDSTLAGRWVTREGVEALQGYIAHFNGPALPADLVESVVGMDSAAVPLDPARFHARLPAQVMSRAGRRNEPGRENHQAWANMTNGGYPGSPGILSFSRVGFTGDGTTALVLTRLYCGGLCGQLAYHVLTLGPDGRWSVSRKYVISNC